MSANGDIRSRQEKARGHPMRAAILVLLSENRGGGLPATAICDEFHDAPNLSTVAYHLLVLCRAELVMAEGDPAAPVYALA